MSDTWLDWVVSLMARFLNMVTFGRYLTMNNSDDCGLTINVKFGKELIIPVKLRTDMTVLDVKRSLSEQLTIPPEELRIIFAGKELLNCTLFQEFDVGDQTIMHAVKQQRTLADRTRVETAQVIADTVCAPLCAAVAQLQLTDQQRTNVDAGRVHFFVYCQRPCAKVCAGKLRVRCSSCGQDTLLLLDNPQCWDDVLFAGRVRGVCQNEGCSGRNAQFYFKCAAHSPSTEWAAPLECVKDNVQQVPCIACTDVSSIVVVFSCESSHVICLECFVNYCTSRLNERKFVHSEAGYYTLGCPANCENSLIRDTKHFRILGVQQYERYQRFATEDYIIKAGGVFCPRPGCGVGILLDESESECDNIVCSRVEGYGCGFVFCRKCLQGAHVGACHEDDLTDRDVLSWQQQQRGSVEASFGEVDEQRAQRSRWDRFSRLTIKDTTKPCPSCRTPTERSGGCMHMQCGRCNFEWCWVCQTGWTRACQGAHWFG